MKAGLIIVVCVLAGAVGAQFLLADPGYVVINFRGYIVEMSVPVLVGLLVIVLLLAWLIVKILRAPRQLGQAAGRMRSGRAGHKLTRGMIEIAEGNLARGEKMLARAAGVSEAPLLNYLQAARAAHLMGQGERRDNWLKQAFEKMPEAANAVLLTQAEFQLDQKQYESALATLRRIEQDSPNHSHALTLLGRIYFQLEDWRHLSDLLPRLRKVSSLDNQTLELWSIRVAEEELSVAPDESSVDGRWATVSKELRQNEKLLTCYFEALTRVGADLRVERELTKLLKRRWIPHLAGLFGAVTGKDTMKQLKTAEGWLTTHPEDADLLLATARLCLRNELWGKARSYLESLLALRPSPEVYQELGRLLNQLGEDDKAAEAYREGLQLAAAPALRALPQPEPTPADDAGTEAVAD
ncbi:MAG: heme biosynthesis HemY N-terminal domain-containing protein [Pseudomonadota bacterium]